jgi:SAM-dependent methyltransferase
MRDPWTTTDTLDVEKLVQLAEALERRAEHPRFAAMLDDYLATMNIDRADTVLDMGCGTGVAARTIAKRVGFRGHVTGVDLSPVFIDTANQLAHEEGINGRVRFEVGDTRSLKLPPQSFDAVVMHTLLTHVDDPVAILAGARRLTRPDGMIAVFDVDWMSLEFEVGRDDVPAVADYPPPGIHFAQPRLIRRMSILAREAGLSIVDIRGYVFTELGTADYWVAGFPGLSSELADAGYVTEAQAAAWVKAMNNASKAGEFYGSVTYYAVLLRTA